MQRLNLILGDQLDADSAIFKDFDPDRDWLWMAEVDGENTHVRHHKHQIVMFLSAMRHFARVQERAGRRVLYTRLSATREEDRGTSLGEVLKLDISLHRPASIRLVLPGDKRVLAQIKEACGEKPLEILEDEHFFSTPEQFRQHAKGRKSLRLEYFYRDMRKSHQILVNEAGEPEGGKWNFDVENRETFRSAPTPIPAPQRFEPDEIVAEVAQVVETRYPDHPGTTATFALPVRREQALLLLEDFIKNRLARFGSYQDAMWEGEFFLYHSRLSTALNLKLLSPREVCRSAESAYHLGTAPLNAVEGFIRQILGWREYIRGVYWTSEDTYAERNFLDHNEALPEFFWTGDTDMRCLADVLRGVQENAYSHHIQRLMVSGLFCLLYGVRPGELNNWHLATHCDAIDWVSTPNVIGMSQFADGGLLASKPYCASGGYIDKMSSYCRSCRYQPKISLGEGACPFTTLYWDFLGRHRSRLANNQRLSLQLKNWDRKPDEEKSAITAAAERLKARIRRAERL